MSSGSFQFGVYSGARRYLLPFLFVGVALGIRWTLLSLTGTDARLLIFFVPVVVCALRGGFGPGLLATALSTVAAAWIAAPRTEHGWAGLALAEWIRLAVFLSEGVLASWLGHRYRQTAQQLQASEERFRALFEQSRDAIAASANGRFIYVNQAFAAMFGYDSTAAVDGREVLEFVVPEAREEIRERYQRRLRGEPVASQYDTRGLRRDGTEFDLELRVSHFTLDGTPYLLAILRDITAERQAQAELRAAKEYAESLLRTANVMVVGLDLNCNVTVFNEAAEEVTGYLAGEITGRNWFDTVAPESQFPLVKAGFLAAAQGKRLPRWRAHNPILTKTGETRRISWQNSLRYVDGRLAGTLSFGVDITDHTRMEEELRRTNRELEQFAYAASHDLQEPLRTVSTFTELFVRRYGLEQDAQARQLTGYIQSGVNRMQMLVRDLLVYSRQVHAEEARVDQSVPLDVCVQETLEALRTPIQEAAAVIDAGPLPTVRGDAGQLAQVLQNLIGNALKYRQQAVQPKLTIWAEQTAEGCTIHLQDNGIGFEPRHAERIFGLFKRLHRDEYAGTGLGLAIVKRIIERHGGRVWAESAGPNQGARLSFTIPASRIYSQRVAAAH